MKTKILIIFTILFSLGASCEPDELPQQQLDCSCGVIIQKDFFQMPTSSFTLLKIKNNCTNEITQIQVSGNQGSLNSEWCDE